MASRPAIRKKRVSCAYSSLNGGHRQALNEGINMTLLHFNMLAMTLAFVSLLVGFSYRDRRWGGVLMGIGVLCVMGMIVYDIQVLSARR